MTLDDGEVELRRVLVSDQTLGCRVFLPHVSARRGVPAFALCLVVAAVEGGLVVSVVGGVGGA